MTVTLVFPKYVPSLFVWKFGAYCKYYRGEPLQKEKMIMSVRKVTPEESSALWEQNRLSDRILQFYRLSLKRRRHARDRES
jgi:hypothetical protein